MNIFVNDFHAKKIRVYDLEGNFKRSLNQRSEKSSFYVEMLDYDNQLERVSMQSTLLTATKVMFLKYKYPPFWTPLSFSILMTPIFALMHQDHLY